MKKEIISVMRRYELKYVLSKDQVIYFQNKISSYMKIDQYGLTTISSLYYDTPSFTLINRSLEKPFYKEKLRLRSYGLANEDSLVFLEIKSKNEKIVYKRRIASNENKVNEFFEKNIPFDEEQISRELMAFKEKYHHLEPKYLILYDRTSYYMENSDLRITLDMNPRYRTSELNLHTSLEGTPLLKEGEAILEIKVQHSIPLWLSKILTEGKIYQSSFSKVGNAHKREIEKTRKQNIIVFSKNNLTYHKGEQQYGFVI